MEEKLPIGKMTLFITLSEQPPSTAKLLDNGQFIKGFTSYSAGENARADLKKKAEDFVANPTVLASAFSPVKAKPKPTLSSVPKLLVEFKSLADLLDRPTDEEVALRRSLDQLIKVLGKHDSRDGRALRDAYESLKRKTLIEPERHTERVNQKIMPDLKTAIAQLEELSEFGKGQKLNGVLLAYKAFCSQPATPGGNR